MIHSQQLAAERTACDCQRKACSAACSASRLGTAASSTSRDGSSPSSLSSVGRPVGLAAHGFSLSPTPPE